MKNILLFYLIFFVGCIKTTTVDNLNLRNGLYYAQSDEPFTGRYITKFENGNISNIVDIKNGIPTGKWVAYGYDGEIVQSGTYFPVVTSNYNSRKLGLKRISFLTTLEDSVKIIDIVIVCDKNNRDTIALKRTACIVAQSHNINCDKVDTIFFIEGEL